eukprot:TRINITY_DN35918_c0_g1_i11.p1 TRINITY_DN35918_c0_g1~~TRINITY_DN35918_c0_g1_i11.p1  ORF type:complete len:237 (-),score=44.60 TRINITY_DN35918_c0_g1_i11:231-941(-)
MNTGRLNEATNNAALEQAMMAAARDYKKELLEQEKSRDRWEEDLDIDDLLDDPELERLHADRIAQMQQEAEKRTAKSKGIHHGTYEEVQEGEFLEISTKEERLVCHFFHRDFRRCAILDEHLSKLAKQFYSTRFIKLSAPDAPFFTEKLKIRMLPCILIFKKGVVMDRVVGFEELGAKDDFRTEVLQQRLLKSGGLQMKDLRRDEDEKEQQNTFANSKIRKGGQTAKFSDDDEGWD